MHSDFVATSTILLIRLRLCGLLPGPGLILDQPCHHLWCILFPESKLLELLTLLCKPMLKMSLLSRRAQIPMESPICLWAEVTKHRFPGAAEEVVSWLAAQLEQHLPHHRRWPQLQRLFLQTHFRALESVVIQPLGFINELSDLVNFILNEPCQVNPPPSVTLTNNSTFPLFPWLIISKKWHNLLKVFSLKTTDMVWGVSA